MCDLYDFDHTPCVRLWMEQKKKEPTKGSKMRLQEQFKGIFKGAIENSHTPDRQTSNFT